MVIMLYSWTMKTKKNLLGFPGKEENYDGKKGTSNSVLEQTSGPAMVLFKDIIIIRYIKSIYKAYIAILSFCWHCSRSCLTMMAAHN